MLRFILWIPILCAAAAQEPRAVLDVQAAAWNRGDMAAFFDTYEDSPSITFLSQSLVRGRADVAERYRRAYDTSEKRGALRFEVLESRPLGDDHALIIGRFFLTRTAAGGGNAAGQFTLIFRRTAAGWKIVHDHTSS